MIRSAAELHARSAARRQSSRGAPRRGAAGLTPTQQLAKLVSNNGGTWLDYRFGIVIGTGVSSWTARVGNQTPFTEATGANQPTYSATLGVDFARAASQRLTGPNVNAAAMLTINQGHALEVLTPRASDANGAPPSTNNPGPWCGVATQSILAGYRTAPAAQTAGTNSVAATAAAEQAFATGSLQLWEHSWFTDNLLRVRVGAAAETTAALVMPLGNIATPMRLGENTPAADYFDGAIKHQLFFPTQLSTTVRAQIRALLTQIEGVPS